MEVMNWSCKPLRLESKLSLTDLQAQLFPVKDKLDRGPILSENRYSVKTLEGNWVERRAVDIPSYVDWKTTYDTDYKYHKNKTWKENQIAKWDNKLNLEGLASEKLLGHKKEYYTNMTTTYDLCYNILPKDLDGPRIRSYNARQRSWVPEQDLTKSYGSLTQFGLKEALKVELDKTSEEGIAKCRWWTTYREEIGKLLDINIERITKFNRSKVDFNVPDLRHFERGSPNKEPCLLPYKYANFNPKRKEFRM